MSKPNVRRQSRGTPWYVAEGYGGCADVQIETKELETLRGKVSNGRKFDFAKDPEQVTCVDKTNELRRSKDVLVDTYYTCVMFLFVIPELIPPRVPSRGVLVGTEPCEEWSSWPKSTIPCWDPSTLSFLGEVPACGEEEVWQEPDTWGW